MKLNLSANHTMVPSSQRKLPLSYVRINIQTTFTRFRKRTSPTGLRSILIHYQLRKALPPSGIEVFELILYSCQSYRNSSVNRARYQSSERTLLTDAFSINTPTPQSNYLSSSSAIGTLHPTTTYPTISQQQMLAEAPLPRQSAVPQPFLSLYQLAKLPASPDTLECHIIQLYWIEPFHQRSQLHCGPLRLLTLL